jgi:hypothetical protein
MKSITFPVILVALVTTACSGGTVSPAPSASAVQPSPPSVQPSPSQSYPAGPIPLLVGCTASTSRCQDLTAGTYATAGGHAFMPGLVVTLPAGWSSAEQDAGEFNLHAVGDTNLNDMLSFWGDIAVADQTGHPAAGIGTTPQELADFLANDPDLIVSERGTATIGNAIPAITLVMRVNPTGPSDDPADCPGDHCAFPLTDPSHWDGPLGITVNSSEDPKLACPCSHAVRLYLASIGSASNRHTFVVAVMVYAPDPDAELAIFEPDVQPIIDSIRLPAKYLDN